jgi:IS30 family transposase
MIQREKILVLCTEKKSLGAIAQALGCCKSTISRELKRNTIKGQEYSAVEAEKKYRQRRKKCRRPKLLENADLKSKVSRLFLE